MGGLHVGRLEGLTGEQRKLLIIVLALTFLAAVEYFYGFFAVDVRAIADSVQATLHMGALMISFFAIELAAQPKDEAFSYGYERVETLAAFTNCCLILFECTFGYVHLVHAAVVSSLQPGSAGPGHSGSLDEDHLPLAETARLGRIGALRCLVNILGLVLFASQVQDVLRRCIRQRGGSFSAHGWNMLSVVLKLIANTVGYMITAASDAQGFIGRLELPLSLLSRACLVYLTLPPLVATGQILLLAIPSEVQPQLHKCLREVSFTDGVLEVLQWNFWPISDRLLVGTVSLRIRSDANEESVCRSVRSICSRVSNDLTVQVLREQPLDMLLADQQSRAIA
mmetsp:Transcript_103523/g.198717  ORF Transcript_103523/g.198717 Transcript_103523/m.198717 type:complete len:339 (+) Transcript_103523:140-1156(+)